MNEDQNLQDMEASFPETGVRLPVLFIGHGSPMNAIEENEFSRAWELVGTSLPRPKAILCISAHWETAGSLVTGMELPKTIHDFGGFPSELYAVQYPAPGSPTLAAWIQAHVQGAEIRVDQTWGLDHGSWSVLARLFPNADIPVVQLSLDHNQPPDYHYALGRELSTLRKRGVLVIGSGNMVHNLRVAVFRDEAFEWAMAFDARLRARILAGDHQALIHYSQMGPEARLAVPTNEHYLPLLYVLGMQTAGEPIEFFATHVTMGSISMRSLRIG